MDYGHSEKRMNVERDRLSGLTDDLIHKILSFVGMKHVVQTSVLSSRWRLIWTSMPYLDFSSKDFSEWYTFSNFVTNVLSRRNNQIETFYVNLTFRGKEFSHKDTIRIMDYAFSHNVQQMTITCLYGLYRWNIEFPFSLFSSCQSLKHLTLIGSIKSDSVMPPSIWELPVLTTLDLKDVRFAGKTTTSVGLFSKCVNLKNLTLSNFDMAETNTSIVTICHPQLSNLTLEDGTWRSEYLHVVTPQLRNLTVIKCDGELLICAPDLTSLKYKTNHTLQFFTDGLPSLAEVDLYIRNPHMRIAHRIFGLLQKLQNVRNLTLNLEIIEVLSLSMELISNQRPPLVNLKSFNIYPLNVNLARQAQKKLNASTKLKSYLLDGSPNGTSSMSSLEDIIAWSNTKHVEYLMVQLRAVLHQVKANTKTNNAHMERGREPRENHKAKMYEQGKGQVEDTKVPLFARSMAEIKSCWRDLMMHFELGNAMAYEIFSRLQCIKDLLTELPASNQLKIQPYFSNLCAEVDTVMNKILDSMKIHVMRIEAT